MKKFLDAASKDAEVMEKLNGLKNPEEFITFAKKMGFSLTAEDLQPEKPKTGELSDDEMDTIAGGIDFAIGVGFHNKGSFIDNIDGCIGC